MTYETLSYTVADNVATITLDRPKNANALNFRMAEELFAVSLKCATDDGVRAVILTATGKHFCVGGDLAEMDAAGDGREALLLEMATMLHQAVIRLSRMDAPLIVAVNGTAGGGGFSLLLAGDVVLAAENAKLVSAYTASGLTPDGSSTYFLAKHVGLLRAKELMLTNRTLTAAEAVEWGLATRMVPDADLLTEAQALAARMAKGPTKAFGGVKRLLDTAYTASIEAQLDKESVSISSLTRGHDAPHGIRSFLNKEKPVFKGE